MTTDTLSHHAIQGSVDGAQAERKDQYSLGQILGIWALVSLPMALLSWVVFPTIVPYIPLLPGLTYLLLMICGLGWQFVVSLVIIYRELGTLRWGAIRQRTWLQTPRDPKTGQANLRLFWWLVPCGLFAGLIGWGIGSYLDAPIAWLFPALQPSKLMDPSQLISTEFQGQWWLLGVVVVLSILNYFLGEEFLFRGILLPKMQGVFGKFDWVANAVLFGLYHVHKPWAIPSNIVGSLALTWPSSRFRSNWMAIILHGVEGIVQFVLVLAIVLGLLP